MTPPQKLLTISQAAHRLGVSKETLRRWERQGLIASHRTVGQHRRYDPAQIDAYRDMRGHART